MEVAPSQVMHNQMTTQVVINTQPQPQAGLLIGSVAGHREWTSGICGCFNDMDTCCCVICNPCYTGQLATRLGDCCCMTCCVPIAPIAMRTRVRTLGGIRGTICMDYICYSYCGLCVMCQMAREMKAMGI